MPRVSNGPGGGLVGPWHGIRRGVTRDYDLASLHWGRRRSCRVFEPGSYGRQRKRSSKRSMIELWKIPNFPWGRLHGSVMVVTAACYWAKDRRQGTVQFLCVKLVS